MSICTRQKPEIEIIRFIVEWVGRGREGGREVMLDGRQIVDVSTTDVELHFE